MSHVEILLVEDNETDAELCLRALGKLNLAEKVLWVKDGVEALNYIFATGSYAGRSLSEHLKLIILDLKVPLVSGTEILQRIKSDLCTKTIPVVILTSSGLEPEIQECYSLGVNSYIIKPVGYERYMETVTKLGHYWMLLNESR